MTSPAVSSWVASPWTLGLALVVVALASWAATGAVLRVLIARRIYDEPNHRSSHAQPKPRGAGLAVVPVVLAAWIAAVPAGAHNEAGIWQVVAGAVLLAVISWADDLKSRPASLRFGVQVAAVTLGLWGLDEQALVFQGVLPFAADRLLAGLAWLWFINLFNFMDGIDGITGVETVTIGGGLALVAGLQALPPEQMFFAAALAAAALGFLPWNWAPARIFLGDVGSVPLGHLLGWLLITAAAGGQWAVALILPMYYLADATWTLVRRTLRRQRLWRAHREHFYQRAVQRGFSHAAVAGRIALCNLALIALALLAALAGSPGAPLGLGGATPWLALALALLAVVALLFILARQAPSAAGPESAPPPHRG